MHLPVILYREARAKTFNQCECFSGRRTCVTKLFICLYWLY